MRFHTLAALAVGSLSAAAAQGDVFTNVPEAAGYNLVYTLPIPQNAAFNFNAVSYSVDNSGLAANANFDRVAYYLELQSGTGPLQYVYVSFDKLAGMTAANKIGVPARSTGENFQAFLSNMNVASNVAGIATGNGLSTGNIEFWPNNYDGGNAAGVPNANPDHFDFGDHDAGNNDYGSMQIHNYDTDGSGSGTDGQTLFGYNNWGNNSSNVNNNSDLGIGNSGAPGSDRDWTFAGNASGYSVRNMQILVRPVPEPTTLGLLVIGGAALFARRRA